MNKNGKSRPLVAQETGRAETAAFGEAAISCTYSTTGRKDSQVMQITDFIPEGKENAVHLKDLKEILHLSGRCVREQIEQARRHGVPVLSDCVNGYWRSNDADEILRFHRSMTARATQIRTVANCVLRGAGLNNRSSQIDGQTNFWSGDESA